MHDIRNDLTVVLGLSRLLARRANKPPPPAWLADRLNRIYAAAEHVASRAAELEDLYGRVDGDDSAGSDEPNPFDRG